MSWRHSNAVVIIMHALLTPPSERGRAKSFATTHTATDEVGTRRQASVEQRSHLRRRMPRPTRLEPSQSLSLLESVLGIDYPRRDKGTSFDGSGTEKMGINRKRQIKSNHRILPSSSEPKGHEGGTSSSPLQLAYLGTWQSAERIWASIAIRKGAASWPYLKMTHDVRRL